MRAPCAECGATRYYQVKQFTSSVTTFVETDDDEVLLEVANDNPDDVDVDPWLCDSGHSVPMDIADALDDSVQDAMNNR